MLLPQLREHIGQGTVILYEDRFPKIVKYDYTTVIASYRGDLLFEKKVRPAIIVSKSTDGYGNRVIVPLTARDNPYAQQVELLDWESHGVARKSYAKINDLKTITDRDITAVLGQSTDSDLSRVLVRVYSLL